MTRDIVGESCSLLFNENTFIKSLKTMLLTMNRSPKHFEFFVAGHFCKRARDIIMACKSYKEGMKVGFLAGSNSESSSIDFRNDVTSCIKPLVNAFNKMGAKVMVRMQIKKHREVVPSSSALLSSLFKQKNLVYKYLEEKSGLGVHSMDLLDEHDSSENTPMVDLSFKEDILKRYENFKKFDRVLDHSDHLFSAQSSAEPPKEWVDKICEEWKILEEHLPETIFVRVYEDRKDLLRAVIIGLEGTPYQDGLFFFDVCFPKNYPNSPPVPFEYDPHVDRYVGA